VTAHPALEGRRPRVALILGSGLGGAADALADRVEIPYDELPGFPRPKVEGHAGTLVAGRRGALEVVAFKGRFHHYDGATAEQLGLLPRAAHALGCEILVATNAAGSLNPAYGPGSVVAICDHINLQGVNPLRGSPAFVSLADAYDPALRSELHAAAADVGLELGEGVYLAVAGPSFETPADLVGMSTVPEVIVARERGLRVAALSVVTNLAEGMGGPPLSHEQTLAEADRGAQRLGPLLEAFLERLAGGMRD
jgi:xanthosine phosphorylase